MNAILVMEVVLDPPWSWFTLAPLATFKISSFLLLAVPWMLIDDSVPASWPACFSLWAWPRWAASVGHFVNPHQRVCVSLNSREWPAPDGHFSRRIPAYFTHIKDRGPVLITSSGHGDISRYYWPLIRPTLADPLAVSSHVSPAPASNIHDCEYYCCEDDKEKIAFTGATSGEAVGESEGASTEPTPTCDWMETSGQRDPQPCLAIRMSSTNSPNRARRRSVSTIDWLKRASFGQRWAVPRRRRQVRETTHSGRRKSSSKNGKCVPLVVQHICRCQGTTAATTLSVVRRRILGEAVERVWLHRAP